MEVSLQLHYPAALSPGRKPLVTIEYKAVWAPEPVWMRLWREHSQSPPGIEPPNPDRPAHSPELFN
jgi:hypothetical protein